MLHGRPVAVLGGARIPFCRQNTAYADVGNLGMSVRTLGAVVEKFGLQGQQLGLGGVALQLDNSIRLGDWVKIDDISGKVVEIRWRFTAIETRNWETVIFPNSMLTRGQVMVLGQRTNQPLQWRRWVYFHVDFRHAPTDVIATVEKALCAQPITNVAATPLPNCIAVDFDTSSTKYAVRYWLTDIARDDPTSSRVRERIFTALKRASIPLAVPGTHVWVELDDAEARARKKRREAERRQRALEDGAFDVGFVRPSVERGGRVGERGRGGVLRGVRRAFHEVMMTDSFSAGDRGRWSSTR